MLDGFRVDQDHLVIDGIAEFSYGDADLAVNRAAGGETTEFNLSATSIGEPDILRELASAIEDAAADPSLLVVEVTETAMMNQLLI